MTAGSKLTAAHACGQEHRLHEPQCRFVPRVCTSPLDNGSFYRLAVEPKFAVSYSHQQGWLSQPRISTQVLAQQH
jgi:hypothetical protein